MSVSADMDKRVTLQAPPTGRNAMNEPSGDWTNIVTDGDGKVWASVVDLTGREYVNAGGTQNTVETKIQIRYRDGITAKMRVLHSADVYTIEAVLGQDRWTLLLMCSRGKPNG
jgi:SPP1 family predicted phage head-tail adaptor